jgi:hypothetical protein
VSRVSQYTPLFTFFLIYKKKIKGTVTVTPVTPRFLRAAVTPVTRVTQDLEKMGMSACHGLPWPAG